jgi:hypothetical protein
MANASAAASCGNGTYSKQQRQALSSAALAASQHEQKIGFIVPDQTMLL